MTRAYLRRCAPWLPLLLALSYFALFNRGAPWRGEWAWSIDAVTGSTVLAGPGTAALAAWLAAADRSRRTLTDPLRRQWAVVLLDALYAWGAGAVTVVVTLTTVVVLNLTTTHGGPAWVPILLLALVVLAFYSSLGAAIGWRCPPLLAIVIAPIVAFAVGLLGALGAIPNVLRLGPSTASLAGLTWDRTVAAGQALAAAGAAVALVVGCARALATRSPLAWAALIGSLATCAAGFGILLSHGHDRFVNSDEQPSVCEGRLPQVCISPSHRRSLASLSQQMARLSKGLSSAGVAAPARFAELLPDRPPGRGTGYFSLDDPNEGSVSEIEAAEALVGPASCPQWFGSVPPAIGVFEARELVAQWLVGVAGGRTSPYGRPEQRWLAEPLGMQLGWIRETYGDLTSCHLDDIALPWARHR